MRDTHAIGDIAVSKIVARCLELGYKVSLPFGGGWSYDLIMDDNEKLYRVQCKHARIRKGKVAFNVCSVKGNKSDHRTETYEGKVDLFLAYCTDNNKVYIVRMDQSTKSVMTLRLTPALNGQEKGVQWARDYEF